ncbi:unnamed protein product [Ilex paraguariensis]|uniref:Uncharacterized protein n=1 Tax=Ilex paraguariensis TaxID=185542 RepID=A0ABC8QVL4_9AQUA
MNICVLNEELINSVLNGSSGLNFAASAVPNIPWQRHQICSLRLAVFLFTNSKCKRYFHNYLKSSKLTCTAMYRK